MAAKRVFTSENVPIVWHVCNLLEQHDITAEVRNANLYSVAGELPPTETWPEVWVTHALDVRRAEQIIRDMGNLDADPGPDWQCPRCGEINGGNFDICWQCQAPREAEP